ncbi:MAG TPA: adenylate/guanylate cyclase domain-containing protein [Polyangia bacterium]|nr:adenylate/guanylate cyclase domain-containing protein [Polyangia bacterium]
MSADAARICPVCGAANPAAQKFCGTCGNRLDAAPRTEERRLATVLFADVSGFTAMSERMDPEDVGEVARRAVACFSEKVLKYGGTVVREFGDEVLAVFGVPLAHEDDPERAIRAALDMRDAQLDSPLGPLQIHVGVNTGEVISTLVNLGRRDDQVIHGDAVNTAARLRAAAPAGSVLVGEETWRATNRAVRYRELPPIEAKGKQHPVLVWEAEAVVPVPLARSLGGGPLIGRHEELSVMKAIWAKVQRERRPHLVTVFGEPGIGKSRLVAEFEARIADAALLLHGRCAPYGQAFGYQALGSVLREAGAIEETDDAAGAREKIVNLARRALAATGQEEDDKNAVDIGAHLALLGGFAVEGAPARVDTPTLYASFRLVLEGLARVRPVVLLIEDLHWADEPLLALLEHVAARARDVPLLVLAQSRPELLSDRPAWGRGLRAFTTISLEPLEEEEARALVRTLAEQHGLSPDVADRIGRGAGGNPLFAEELVAMLAERRGTEQMPSAIKALISARIDALAPEERLVMQRAAVFGKVFWEKGLRFLGAPEPLAQHLEALEQKDLVRAQPRSRFRGDREFLVKHDLIRDVSYDMLLRADRRRLHGAIVDWIESVAGEGQDDYLDLLAHHAAHADQAGRAIRYLSMAAERASRTAAHVQAAALLAQAIELTDASKSTEGLVDLLFRRGCALRAAAVWAGARESLERALALVPPDANEMRAAVLVELAAACLWAGGDHDARQHADVALGVADAAGRQDLAVGAMYQIATTEAGQGNVLEGVRLFRAAEERARAHDLKLRDATLEGSILNTIVLYWAAQHPEGIDRSQQAIARAREVKDTMSTMLGLPHLGLSLAAVGRYGEAIEVFEEGRKFGREYEVWAPLARATSMAGGLHLELHDYQRHRELAEEARELGRSRFPPVMGFTGVDLILNHARRGDAGAGQAIVGEVSEQVEKATAWHRWLSHMRLSVARAELALTSGDTQGALEHARHGLELARKASRPKYEALALHAHAAALHRLGRTREAIADLEAAVSVARKNGDPALLVRILGALLPLAGTDELAAEARRTVEAIAAALPDAGMRQRFLGAEAIKTIVAP